MLPVKVNGKLFRQLTTLKVNGSSWDDIAQKLQLPVDQLAELPWKYKRQWLEYSAYAQQLADQETLSQLKVGLQADFAKTDDLRLRVQIANSLVRLALAHKPKETPREKPPATPKKTKAKPLERVAPLPPPEPPPTKSPSVEKTPLLFPKDPGEPPPLTAEELAEIMAVQEKLIRSDQRKMMRSPTDASKQLMQRTEPDPDSTLAAGHEREKLASKTVLRKSTGGSSFFGMLLTLVCLFFTWGCTTHAASFGDAEAFVRVVTSPPSPLSETERGNKTSTSCLLIEDEKPQASRSGSPFSVSEKGVGGMRLSFSRSRDAPPCRSSVQTNK
jgi:hypothetical protein